MSLSKLLPIPDKWKVKDAVVYKVYELDFNNTLHSMVWATGNEFFIGQSYRDHSKFPIWPHGHTEGTYKTGWHSFVSIKGARAWLKHMATAMEDCLENYTIVKIKMREPVAYGIDELGSRTIVFKYKTLIEEVSYDTVGKQH